MLNETQFRKVETGSRILLSLMILVFVLVAVGTYEKTQELEQAAVEGECSYLFEQGYLEDQQSFNNSVNYSTFYEEKPGQGRSSPN